MECQPLNPGQSCARPSALTCLSLGFTFFYSPPSPTVFILTTNSYKTLQYQKGMLSANNTFLHTQHPLKTATHSIIPSTKTIVQKQNLSLVSLAHKHMYSFPTPVCIAIPWALPDKVALLCIPAFHYDSKVGSLKY